MTLGFVSALFLAPKSGKENREEAVKRVQELKNFLQDEKTQKRVKEIFGTAAEDGMKIYDQVRSNVQAKLEDVKDGLSKEKYMEIVNDVTDQVKNQTKVAGDKMVKVRSHLVDIWGILMEKEVPKKRKKS